MTRSDILIGVADVAVISVLSSSTVGVLGTLSGFYAQRLTMRNEQSKRLETRREDLRNVLDEAAAIAMACNPPASRWDLEMYSLALVMDKVMADMALQRARLGVRVGPRSPVFLAYAAVEEAIAVIEQVLRAAPRELTVEDIRDLDRLDEHTRASAESINHAYRTMNAALRKFLTASAALVGARA